MKKIFICAILQFTVIFSFSQTTGLITGLKDTWNESITYVGELKNKMPNGLGLAIYSNNYVLRYAGYFVNGKYEGKGVLLYSDGSFLSGDWKAGKLNGQGAHFDKSKNLYIGGFVNGEKTGMGTFLLRDNGFLQGIFKNDTYNGRCIYIDNLANVISDNIYVNGKKNGQGYQYELKDKKLFEGTWKEGTWEKASTGNYFSFLKSPDFFAEKTDNQIIMGGIDKKNHDLTEDTSFFYDLRKKMRYFGYNHRGFLEKGLIIKDDSTRFLGNVNKDGAYGTSYFLKLNKYYDEGNYVKDFLNGDKSLSINLEKKTVYCGQSINNGEFTGKAWFANNSNDLYNGTYLKGKFTGEGWRIDKKGNFIKGTFEDGNPVKLTGMVTGNGVAVNIAPKTLEEALATSTILYDNYYDNLIGKENNDENYETFSYQDKSPLAFPGTVSGDVIVTDDLYYVDYIAHYLETGDYKKAAAKYNNLSKQVSTASIILKKGDKPVKFSGIVNQPSAEKKASANFFMYPATVKGYSNFAAAVVIMKTTDDKNYRVLLVTGDEESIKTWIDDLNK